MLMENRAEDSHGSEKVKKSRSLDLQSLYDQEQGVPAVRKISRNNSLKRKLGADHQAGGRKKAKREVPLSSLSSDKKSRKKLGEVYRDVQCAASSEPSKPERGASQKCNGLSGLGGITLNLTKSIIQVPKRPRDLTRRKKLEVDPVIKHDSSGSKAASVENALQLNGDSIAQNGKFTQDSVENSGFKRDFGGAEDKEVEVGKCSVVDHKERTSDGLGTSQHTIKEDVHSSVHDGDKSSKKAKRILKHNDQSRREAKRKNKRSKPHVDGSDRTHRASQEDDEENLEANAARMLSSRFDPSCTGFSGSSKSCKSPSGIGLPSVLGSNEDHANTGLNTQAESDTASGDRVLRPRDHSRQKGRMSKRRRYYEIVSKDLDVNWVLNRRIKIFWPLDQKWYFGLINDYDSDKKVHHINYDDRDEEWIDLHNERFKLLLLPSEVPDYIGRKRRRKEDYYGMKGNDIAPTEDDCQNGSSMESEPIISWLARSSSQIKSSTSGTGKKQKSDKLAAFHSSSFSSGTKDSAAYLDASSSERNTYKLDSDVVLPNTYCSAGEHETSVSASPASQDDKRAPIVYFRRRFRKGERGLVAPGRGLGSLLDESSLSLRGDGCPSADRSLAQHDCFFKRSAYDHPFWSLDDTGLLTLTSPADLCDIKLRFQVPLFSLLSLKVEILWLSRALWMAQHGALMTAWPMVDLEILFVDNAVGLRFLLFEGSLKQFLMLAFLVLDVFRPSNRIKNPVDRQLPVTSIRFRFSCTQDVLKELVFAYYNFEEVANSKWLYLDRKLKRHCLLAKQLPPSECTYDNIKELRHGCCSSPEASGKSSTLVGARMKSRRHVKSISNQSSGMRGRRLASKIDEKLGRLPPLALSFAAAPTFFLKLHLRLLMERSIPCGSLRGNDSLLLLDYSDGNSDCVDCSGVDDRQRSSRPFGFDPTSFSTDVTRSRQVPGLTLNHGCHAVSDCIRGNEISGKLSLTGDDYEDGAVQGRNFELDLSSEGNDFSSRSGTRSCTPNGINVKVRPFNLIQNAADNDTEKHQQVADSAIVSSNPTAHKSLWYKSRSLPRSSLFGSLSPVQDGRPESSCGPCGGFSTGPKKPRTQVAYSLPVEGHDLPLKNKSTKGFSHKRIRRSTEKRTSEASGISQRSTESLSCDANVLITTADLGWRECGVRIALEHFDHNEWRLAVRISGATKFSYKAHQFLQPGTTNRYTHAMMWKGGKDWTLEFRDRSQWMLFKEMHEECYNRNFRAASVKNIPIPGVRLIEDNVECRVEVPFIRPPSAYLCQLQNDVDMAMDPSRVLYDMHSDDERWISKIRSSLDCGVCSDITDDIFEKIMDTFEKVAFAKQSDQLTPDDLEEIIAVAGSMEAIKIVHEYWQEKRQKRGMPLIRNFQPPLWEKYQHQVKEWELKMMKNNGTMSSGSHGKSRQIEKPQMFAFCLKPRGLEVPSRGSKQRSHKKFSIAGPSSVIGGGDLDAFHPLGRRSMGYAFGDEKVVCPGFMPSDSSPVFQGSPRVFSPRVAGAISHFSLSGDGHGRSHYPKLYRNKSKKIGSILYPSDPPTPSSHHQRNLSGRNGNNGWILGPHEWPSQNHYEIERSQRHCIEQLDASDLDEFRLRDASSAAQHATNMAKLKREKAQRLLYRADLAIHKAVVALMTAEAIKAAAESSSKDA